MNRLRNLFVPTMIAAAGAVTALSLSATASADPVPAPPNPGAQLLTQLSTVGAAAPQLMQTLASSMSGASAPAATAATPATPPPGATASLTLPQTPTLPTAPAAACRSCGTRRSGRRVGPGQRYFVAHLGAARPAVECRRAGRVASERLVRTRTDGTRGDGAGGDARTPRNGTRSGRTGPGTRCTDRRRTCCRGTGSSCHPRRSGRGPQRPAVTLKRPPHLRA